MYLSEINIYPIKSLGGISLQQARIERRGLQYDRRWMLIDENNEFLSQRELPQMAALRVVIGENGLEVAKNETERILIPFAPAGDTAATVKIWSSRCRARIYDDASTAWFSDMLGVRCRLALMPEETRRKVNYFYAVKKDDHVSFADGYPFLLSGAGSLAELNRRLEKPLPMNRFRPNFVVAGAEPFAEDGWKRIRIGATVFHLVKPCARCVVTTIDQSTGAKNGPEPLKTLASFRVPKRGRENKVLFGQNLIAEQEGDVLSVGDRVEVLATKPRPVAARPI